MHSNLQIKRIYEPYSETDGTRILVDRLWPRGVRKEDARVHQWLKDIAPSPELRKWFCHQAERFAEFCSAYEQELSSDTVHQAAVRFVVDALQEGPVTLLYAARDPQINHAVVLYRFIQHHIESASHELQTSSERGMGES